MYIDNTMTHHFITFRGTVTIMERSRDTRIQLSHSAHVLASGVWKYLFHSNHLTFSKTMNQITLANHCFVLFVCFFKGLLWFIILKNKTLKFSFDLIVFNSNVLQYISWNFQQIVAVIFWLLFFLSPKSLMKEDRNFNVSLTLC